MKLTLQLKLLPSVEQAQLLLDTMRRFNEAASFAAGQGFAAGAFSQPSIHKLAYAEIRRRFGLSAQLAVRAIGKAVESFACDKSVCPTIRPYGAVTYDQRNLSFKGLNEVSLSTLRGRQKIGVVYGEYQAANLKRMRGQVDLVYRDGLFFLYATIEFQEAPSAEVHDFLGVDLGIVSLATTSEGESFSGAAVDRNRRRRETARKQYQRKGTKNAKRRLKKMAGRQRRFQANVNHTISKRIVARAKALGAGIALEDLKGIRQRVETTVSRRFRRRFGNWSFHQLRLFVEYKAQREGIPVVTVDPHSSSQTCSACGHCERANRPDQVTFHCKHCGFSTNADHNAALTLRGRALGQPRNPAPKAVATSPTAKPQA